MIMKDSRAKAEGESGKRNSIEEKRQTVEPTKTSPKTSADQQLVWRPKRSASDENQYTLFSEQPHSHKVWANTHTTKPASSNPPKPSGRFYRGSSGVGPMTAQSWRRSPDKQQ